MKYETIKYEVKQKTGFLSLSNPPQNGMGLLFFNELFHLIHKIENDKDINALIINSAGRHFSSGTDIQQLLSLFKDSQEFIPEPISQNSLALKKLSNFPFPVIACLKGICYGSALELALSAHFRIAAKNVLLSFPETGFALIPGLGGIFHTLQCMSKADTMQFVLSGNALSAEDSLNNNMIDLISEKNNLTEQAIKLADISGNDYKKEFKKQYLAKLKSMTD